MGRYMGGKRTRFIVGMNLEASSTAFSPPPLHTHTHRERERCGCGRYSMTTTAAMIFGLSHLPLH